MTFLSALLVLVVLSGCDSGRSAAIDSPDSDQSAVTPSTATLPTSKSVKTEPAQTEEASRRAEAESRPIDSSVDGAGAEVNRPSQTEATTEMTEEATTEATATGTAGVEMADYVWETWESGLRAKLTDHVDPETETARRVTRVAFAPSGQNIASGDDAGFVCLRNLNALDQPDSVRRFAAHEKGIVSLQFSPDEQFLVTASLDGGVRVWQLETLEPVNRIRTNGRVRAGFRADGKLLVLRGDWSQLLLGTPGIPKPLQSWTVDEQDTAFVMDRTGDRVATWTFGSPVTFRSLDSETQLSTPNPCRQAQLSADGSRLLTGSGQGVLQLHATEDMRLIWKVPSLDALALAFSPDGQLFCLAGSGSPAAVRVGEVESGEEVARYDELQGRVEAIDFSPDGAVLAIGAGGGTVQLCRLPRDSAEIAAHRRQLSQEAQQHLKRAQSSRVFQERERELSAAIDLQYDLHQAFFERGLGRMSVGEQSGNRQQLEAALRDFQWAIHFEKRDPQYHFQAAYTHGLLQQLEQSVQSYSRAIALLEERGKELSDKDRQTLAFCHLNGCDVLLRLNKAEEAAAWGQAATRVAPDIPMAQYNRGRACAASRDYACAFESFEKFRELMPRNPDAFSSLGMLHHELGELDQAAQYLSVVFAMNRADERLLSAMIDVELTRGHYSNALWYLDVLEQQPAGVTVWSARTRGKVWYELGDVAKARDLLRQAIAKDDTDPFNWMLLGDLEQQQGQQAEAQKCYQKVETLLPAPGGQPDDAWASYIAGTYLELHEQAERAVASYEAVLAADKTHFWTLSRLALLLAAHPDSTVRDGQRAMELATRSCELTLDRVPWCLSTRAAACAELGQFDEAITYQTQAIDLAPNSQVQEYVDRLTLYEKQQPFRFDADREKYFLQQPEFTVDRERVRTGEFEAVTRAAEDRPKRPPEQIFTEMRDAVVLVESDIGFGTGMILSRSGYILTCAHILPYAGAVTVRYLPPGGDTDLVAKGLVVSLNPLRDLALLKVDVDQPLATVILARETTPQTGAKVLGIGNPSVGERIIDRVLADGIVSKPRQQVENPIPLDYLQSTLRIGPGFSGGPMLDETGRVIGVMVSTKPDIGATFAVPLDAIEDFLALGE